MKAEKRRWGYSKQCPQGKIFEVGEDMTGWSFSPDLSETEEYPELKPTVKKKSKKTAKKKAK